MIAEQLRLTLLPPIALFGADWQEQEPFASERGKSCPALIVIDGRVLEYVPGSLLAGKAEYRETVE